MDAYVAPISHAQRRLWFLDRLEPGNPVYHIPVAVRFRGQLDRAAVERALASIVGRHDILRTSFALESGEPVQIVRDTIAFALPVEPATSEADLSAKLTAEARRSFDLARGPLWRALLLSRAPDDHVLLLTLHHIIADGWSLGVLVTEFTAAYRAAVAHTEAELPELAIQFADFVEWQNETLAGAELGTQLAAWREHLGRAPTVLELPADFPRPAAQSYRGALLLRTLPATLVAPLQAVARREGATLFMTLLAAFETLLLRVTRQEEFLVGTPIAGRARSETESLIGFFVNTLVLRADLAGDPAFTELLRRTKQECLGAFARETTPFDRVVDAVQPARDRSRTPLFQVYFTLQNAPRNELRLPGLTTSVIEVDTQTAKVDLTLALEESPAGIAARWEYCTDVFAPATIERLANAFDTLVAGIVANPAEKISRLPLVSAGERAALLALGGGAVTDFSTNESLGAWFSRQAALTPDRIAVNGDGVALTYRELDTRTNQLARHLRRHGVGPDVPVGLCLGRSVEQVVGILGILKAGGAYVPVDPAYPRDRIEFLLEDSGMAALITHRAPAGITHPHHIDLEAAADAIATESAEPLGESVGAEHGAYIIYTSGSTGRPKGCIVTHGNVTRLMRATEAWYRFDERDVWTLFHSYAFDFSVWEIWGALLYGGRLVVVPYEVSRSPEAFHQLLESEQVTVLNQTPSAFRQLIAADADRPQAKLALRYVIFGGEALELSMLAPWFARHGDRRPQVVNMYGITETTVHVTYRPITLADLAANRGSVIGERIPDLTLYVVDEHLQPVTVGVPGELLVGGAGLARGYLNRAELTAQRFVASPFGPGRLYRSGDLARWLADGDLEYLGRIDQQVKIRGFRIELGEIERVLGAIAGVRECAVLAREERPGEKRLVAYLVRAAGATEPDARAAREASRARLPDHMVPAAFVFLETLPLTAHGKLDRRALPAPEANEAASADYVAPATPAEHALAEIWARVLGLESVGAQDNFFALGGDSILTIQVVSQATKAGYKISPKDLFESQTLAELACAARPIGAATAVVEPVSPALASAPAPQSPGVESDSEIEDRYPLTPTQAGILFQSVFAPESGVYFEQFWGDLRGALDVEAFRASWQGLVDRHPGLRTRFEWRDVPEPRQCVVRRAELPFASLDWSAKSGAEIAAAWETLLADERARGFDFSCAPLMRVTLVRLAAERWRWLWNHHHILLDGWCLPLVFQDVLGDYEHRVNRAAAPAPGLDYRRHVDWVRAQDLATAERYWRGALAGFESAPALALPAPTSAQANEAAPAEIELRFSPDESAALRTWARRHGLTLNTLFQGAWALALQRYGAGEDVVFGVTVSGRPPELSGVERIIGLFINTLPLRARIDPARENIAWLRELQGAQAEMRQFEYSPLVEVQGWSDVPRGQPLFESIFVFENYPGDEAIRQVRSSLTLEGLHTRERTNYPLTAAVVPAGGIALRLNYDARRFASTGVERLLAHWQRLVSALASARPVALGAVEWLGTEESAQARRWREAPADLGAFATVMQIVAEHARRTPSAPALLGPKRVVSYAAFESRSNRLAQHLVRLGVKRGECVAVCAEKTPELAIAILAVLKAGGAFVPLDPHFARERLAFLVADSRPVALLGDASTAWTAALTPVPFIALAPDDAGAPWASLSDTAPTPPLTPDDLAYVIHTSGSTGKPKGVMLTHGGLTNLARAQAAATALAPGQRALQFASISFDAAVSEIFMPLVAGAALWLEPREAVPEPRAFARALREARIDHATLPPALLNALAPGDFPALGTLLVAGEAGSEELYRTWSRGRRLFNAYGPTEITVCATMAEIAPDTDAITIGRPLANLAVHVLDAALQPLPAGLPGEIFVGGIGVGRGYLNRPDLTAERFVPDPFSASPGARLYRTGDRGRWRDDGRIEFLGRTDHQVKIRGFRVEPGEIEAALAAHPAVGGALVVAQMDATGGKFLLGYVVPRDGAVVAATELKQHLQSRLPEFLVPRHVLMLPAWPLTSAGKIDRRALPQPEVSTAAAAATHAPLAGEIEEALAGIWREVLRAAHVGPDDNFFELGGDSIVSLQIVARAHQLGYEITPRQLFEAPTIRALAAVATRVRARASAEDDERGAVPLTPIQHWFFNQQQPDAHHWNQSVVLELRRPIAPAVLRDALAATLARHGAFRLRFTRDAQGRWQQSYAPREAATVAAAIPGFELPVHPLESLTAIATGLQSTLDLAHGSLCRAALFTDAANTTQRLFLTIHHLAVDGVSWRILAGDLAQACAQLAANQPALLPAPATSYARWARMLETRAQTEELRAELTHWRTLAGAAGSLPIDFAPDTGARGVEAAETFTIELDSATTVSLLRDGSAAYRLRVDELLLAALAHTLATWTGREANVIHLENHGREDLGDALDVSRTVGWFTSLYPVRLECAKNTDAAALLTHTKESLRAVPRHGVGFGLLRHLCADDAIRRELAALAPAELCFNYLGQVDHTLGPDAPFALADVPTGPGSSPRGHRAHLIDINAIVTGGRLKIDWIYSGRAHRRATVARQAEAFLAQVRTLLAHCASPAAGGPTPSDFTNVKLDARELDALLDDLAEPSPN